jgi:hypothetical protein
VAASCGDDPSDCPPELPPDPDPDPDSGMGLASEVVAGELLLEVEEPQAAARPRTERLVDARRIGSSGRMRQRTVVARRGAKRCNRRWHCAKT